MILQALSVILAIQSAMNNDLIKKLGHDDFMVREEATWQLERVVPAPFATLGEAIRHRDPEIAHRSKMILRRLIMKADVNNQKIDWRGLIKNKLLKEIENKDFQNVVAAVIVACEEQDPESIAKYCKEVRLLSNVVPAKTTTDQNVINPFLIAAFRRIGDFKSDITSIEAIGINTGDGKIILQYLSAKTHEGEVLIDIKFYGSHNMHLLFTVKEVNFRWEITAIGAY